MFNLFCWINHFLFCLCVQVQLMWVFILIWVFAFFVLQLYSSVALVYVCSSHVELLKNVMLLKC